MNVKVICRFIYTNTLIDISGLCLLSFIYIPGQLKMQQQRRHFAPTHLALCPGGGANCLKKLTVLF